MPTTTKPTDLGRAVFLSAESAAIDDFSQVSDTNLTAAIAYGDGQLILPRRAKAVLSLLRAEQSKRSRKHGVEGVA